MGLTGLWGSLFSRKDGPALHKLPRRFRARLRLEIGDAVPAAQASAAALQERVQSLLDVAAEPSAAPAAAAGAAP
jgi:hypothetical protein